MRLKLIDPRSLLARDEARVIDESQLAADPALTADGWTLRFIADADRTKEALELYRQIGFEVMAVPLHTEVGEGDDCAPCQASIVTFSAVYTRKQP